MNAAIVAANDAARFGLQLTEDQATQQALADEAIAEGAKLGIPVTCSIVHNESPAYGGLPASSLYQALCNGNSAAQLIRSFQTTASATPASSAGPAASTWPTAVSVATPPAPISSANTGPNPVVSDPGMSVAGFSLPSWALYAGLAAAAFMFFGGKR